MWRHSFALGRGVSFKRVGELRIRYSVREVEFDCKLSAFVEERGDDKDGGGYAGFAEFLAFDWTCDTEPVGASVERSASNFDSAVSVTVGFHDNHEFAFRADTATRDFDITHY
jgi:hypothetical protein